MADDKALRSWVDDQLFALLGYAESSVAAFVIALGALSLALRTRRRSHARLSPGKKATSASQLAAQLTEQARPAF